jgi:hypothetical protein
MQHHKDNGISRYDSNRHILHNILLMICPELTGDTGDEMGDRRMAFLENNSPDFFEMSHIISDQDFRNRLPALRSSSPGTEVYEQIRRAWQCADCVVITIRGLF